MWQNRFSENSPPDLGGEFGNKLLVAAICILAVIPAWTQSLPGTVTRIELTAPQDFVISGRSLQLRATARTFVGATVSGFRPVWRSSQPEIARVDENGRVQGLMPGVAEIQANGDSVAGRFEVRVYPLAVEIMPSHLELEVGQTAAVTVKAIDADGRALAGVPFVWFSSLPAVVSVNSLGATIGLEVGEATITALIGAADPNYHFGGNASVTVRARPVYSLTQAISNDVRTSGVTLRSIGDISYGGADRFVFIGTLSNGSQAAMVYESGSLRTLAVTGDNLPVADAIIQTIDGITMNGRGEVVALINRPLDIVVAFRGAALSPVVIPPPSRSGACCSCCINIGPKFLNDNGDLAMTLWSGRGNEMWVVRANGESESIVTTGQSLPVMGVADWINLPLISNSGAVTFSAGNAQRQGAFLWESRQVQKVYVTGDVILGRTVQWLDTPMRTDSGDIYGRFGGPDFNIIGRFSAGSWRQVVPAPSGSSSPNIWSINNLYDARGSTVLFKGDSDLGSGLFRLEGEQISMVARYGGDSANDWQDISNAAVRSTGDVLVQGRHASAAARIALTSGGASIPIVETGRAIDGGASTGLRWRELGRGINPSGPVFRTAGGVLATISRNTIQPLISPGDVLGSEGRLIAIDQYSSSRGGNILVETQTTTARSIHLLRNGVITRVLAPGQTTMANGASLNVNWMYGPHAVNDRGQMAVQANFDQSAGVLFFPGAGQRPTLVMSRGSAAPGGGTYDYVGEIAIDETGRVAFVATLAGGRVAVFLWENGQIRRIGSAGDFGPGGLAIANFSNLQAAGDRFYAFLSSSNQAEQIAYYDGSAWRAVVTRGSALSFGSSVAWFHNNKFVASANGDVAYFAGTGEVIAVVHKADGRDIPVARRFDRLGRQWLTGTFIDLNFSDAGHVFFTDITTSAAGQRIVLVQADPPLPVRPFTVANRGGSSLRTDGAGILVQGYTRIQPDSGSTTASGIAILGFRQNNVLVSEAGVPASPLIQNGRIYAEVNGPLNTGVAIANPNSQAAVVTFQVTNSAGPARSGTFTIQANKQESFFLNGDPVNGGNAILGTLSFSSSVPISVVALRSFFNERTPSEFLMTTLPVVNTSVSVPAGTQFIPHFADGGGITTQILLVNPTENALTGVVEFYSQAGQLTRSLPYSVGGRDSVRLSGSGGAVLTQGSVRVVPSGGGAAPAAMAVFTYKPAGVTLSEAGVPAIQGSAFRMYVESSGVTGTAGNIESGLAIANTSNAAATVTLELTNLDGSTTGLPSSISRTLPGAGQIVGSLGSFFSSLPNPFRGVLRVSASSAISVIGIRSRYNELGGYLMTTTPPTNEGSAASSTELLFPHIVNGSGFTTEFIIFSGAAGQSPSGNLRFFANDGAPLILSLN